MKILPRDVTKPLTKREEITLITLAQKGDRKAVDALILRNYRFLVLTAYNFLHRGLSHDDLVQEGAIGLSKAIPQFEPARGNRFLSFAAWSVTAHMQRATVEQGTTVRIPHREYINVKNTEANEERKQMIRNARFSPNFEELQASGIEFPDPNPTPEDKVSEGILRARARALIQTLPKREAYVLTRAFGFDGPPESLDKISQVLGCSKEWVRKIRDAALLKLKDRAKVLI